MNPVNLEEDPELKMRTAILANASFLPGEILHREPSYIVPGLWTWRDHNLMICVVLSHRFLIACYTEVESYYKYQGIHWPKKSLFGIPARADLMCCPKEAGHSG